MFLRSRQFSNNLQCCALVWFIHTFSQYVAHPFHNIPDFDSLTLVLDLNCKSPRQNLRKRCSLNWILIYKLEILAKIYIHSQIVHQWSIIVKLGNTCQLFYRFPFFLRTCVPKNRNGLMVNLFGMEACAKDRCMQWTCHQRWCLSYPADQIESSPTTCQLNPTPNSSCTHLHRSAFHHRNASLCRKMPCGICICIVVNWRKFNYIFSLFQFCFTKG